ncbi:MAG: pantoate--beta-alanine ligase [Verrucomicrobiota bacterium]
MTTVFSSIADWRYFRKEMLDTETLGVVPTLGGLHEGHFALVRRSLEENDRTVVTVFLNRVQFNKKEDYEKYPANFEEDVAALEAMGVDAVLAPEFDAMYPDNYDFRVSEKNLSNAMEGAHRPGHFDGVLTVVMRLLNIAQADRAYFGQKDYQQLALVEGMVKAFFMPTKIVACPTVRSDTGLALSSRNRRLSKEGLEQAAFFPQILNTSASVTEAISRLKGKGFEVEYVEDRDGRRLAAVVIEGVRLIDNLVPGSLQIDSEVAGRREARL